MLTEDGRTERVAVADPFAVADQPVELEYSYGPELLPADSGPLNLWRYVDLLPIGPGAVRRPA